MRLALMLAMGLALTPPSFSQVTRSYEYDALGRLSRVTPSGGTPVCYAYDAVDNRTNVNAGCTGGGNSPPTANYDYIIDVVWDTTTYNGYLYVLYNDTDPDLPNDTLTVIGVSGSPYVSIASNDVFFSGPPGFHSFTYTIRDAAGLTSNASVDVEIIYCSSWGGC